MMIIDLPTNKYIQYLIPLMSKILKPITGKFVVPTQDRERTKVRPNFRTAT
jgi:hypothetical protein